MTTIAVEGTGGHRRIESGSAAYLTIRRRGAPALRLLLTPQQRSELAECLLVGGGEISDVYEPED